MKTTKARKAKAITPTNFRWYDYCINPYVGCEHGCAYCYVRFLVKDTETPPAPWGEFVRVREFIKVQIPKEIAIVNGKRVCLGTVTDPYQPSEKKERLTRFCLEALVKAGVTKVGVYTKSDLALEDLELFKKLPNPNLHMTITPIQEEIRSKVEKVAPDNNARFDVVKKFKEAGIKVRLNVAPLIPSFSDGQAYKQSMTAMADALGSMWLPISMLMYDKVKYAEWKAKQREAWMNEWAKNGSKNIIAIWSDHENEVSEDMSTGKAIDPKMEIS